jgi:hypothetical protein
MIYGSLLLLVMLWLLLRRSSGDAIEATHAVLDALRDAVDGRLTAEERARVVAERNEKGEPLEGGIHAGLVAVLESPAIDGRLTTAGPIASGAARRWLERLLPTRLERWIVYAGLVISALGAVVAGLALLGVYLSDMEIDLTLLANDRIEIPDNPLWVLLLLGTQVLVGLSAAIALGARVRGSVRWVDFGIAAVLIDLVAGELVAFYAVQFGALSEAVRGLILLGLLVDLRIRERNARVDATEG